MPPVCGSYPRISLSTTLSLLGTSHVSYHTHHLQPPTHHLQCTHKTHTCTEVHLTPKQIAGFSPVFVSFIAALQRLQRTVAFLPDFFLFLQGCLSPKPQPFSCALSLPRRHHHWPPGRAAASVPSYRAASVPASGLSSLPCISIALRHHSHFARCFPELQPAWPSSALAPGPSAVCLPFLFPYGNLPLQPSLLGSSSKPRLSVSSSAHLLTVVAFPWVLFSFQASSSSST